MIKKHKNIDSYTLDFILAVDRAEWEDLIRHYFWSHGETKELINYLDQRRKITDFMDKQKDQLSEDELEEIWEEESPNEELEEVWEEVPPKILLKEEILSKPDSSIVDNWVKEFDASILDFFISPMERMVIKQQLKNLVMTQKKIISDMILHSKAFIKLSDEEQRKQLAGFIRNLAKQGGRPSKF
jgi:hypothetical protein